MPDLLRLKTEDWELTVWSNDISKKQMLLRKTLKLRDKTDLFNEESIRSEVVLSSALKVSILSLDENCEEIWSSIDKITSIPLNEIIFFENNEYQFEWVFDNGVSLANIEHKINYVNNKFRFSNRHGLPVLCGTINTANDIGWLRLPLAYFKNEKKHIISISFEIMPTKMDIRKDLPKMYNAIDNVFPLWRFSIAQKTEQDAFRDNHRGDFPLLWLAYFEKLKDRLTEGLKVITHTPHSRLLPYEKSLKADKIKGRVNNRLLHNIANDKICSELHRKYSVFGKQLSVDTPENRFIKMVVDTTKNKLDNFHSALSQKNKEPEKQILSNIFLEQLKGWQSPLIGFQGQSFYKEIGSFSGVLNGSLTIQKKSGYSAVYKIWQELKFYLDTFSDHQSVSMKSVSEIYEIWCFLELRRIIIEKLRFTEVEIGMNVNPLHLRSLEYQLGNGMCGAFSFQRFDGLKIRLAHEPTFKEKSLPIRTWQVAQKPDIVLEVTYPDGKQYIWIFDAKYRIKSSVTSSGETCDNLHNVVDHVPDDAINQMHRYRDALIHVSSQENTYTDKNKIKSRPIFGAFALYPGFFDQSSENNWPYFDSVNEIGIGAFPLLPSSDGDAGSRWLEKYLVSQIGQPTFYENNNSEKYFLQESVRIPSRGMTQVLYPELVMTVSLGPSGETNKSYSAGYEDGTAGWYHLPAKVFLEKFENIIISEVCYLGIGIKSAFGVGKSVQRLWKIKSVTLVKRSLITVEQSGKNSDSDELYWLFELHAPVLLKNAITAFPCDSFRASMRLTTVDYIIGSKIFEDVKSVYEGAIS